MRSSLILKTAALVLLGSAPSLLGAEVAKQSDSKAQLKEAVAMKKGLKGLKGEEKRAKLKEIAEAYAAVGKFFPESLPEFTEASFRLGEIRRSLGDREGALAAFEKAAELKGNRRFGARALIEIGHLHRRSKKLSDAGAAYDRAAKEFAELLDQRDTAWLWAGKTRFAMKDNEGARSVWIQVVEKSNDPLDQIRAYDLIAGSFLAEGKSSEASAAVEKCQHALAPVAEEPSSRGSRVKRALERMKSVSKLTPSVAESNDDDDDDSEG